MTRGALRTAVVAGASLLLSLALAACGQHSSTAPSSEAAAGAPSTPTSSVPTTLTTTTASTPTRAPSPTTATTAVSPAVSGPSSCHATGSGLYVLPDPTCTPGATNPQVTQANIGSTICASGWTETVRPPESYTEPLKEQQMAAYGDTGPISSYEQDHLIPLELAGSPTSPENLWPEPGASPNPKDAVEDAANKAVCDGTMSLVSAQQAIASNWIALGQQLGVAGSASPSSSTSTGASSTSAPATSGGASSTNSAPSSSGAPFCQASASPSNDGYSGDYQVNVTSDQPDQTVTASDAGDSSTQTTDNAGSADVRLYVTSPGEMITTRVGAASCSTTA